MDLHPRLPSGDVMEEMESFIQTAARHRDDSSVGRRRRRAWKFTLQEGKVSRCISEAIRSDPDKMLRNLRDTSDDQSVGQLGGLCF